MIKKCKLCGEEFLPKNKQQLFCTPKCQKTLERLRAIVKKGFKKCILCNSAFFSTNDRQKMCSFNCSDIMQNLKGIIRRGIKCCKFCGKMFFPKQKGTIFCSSNCVYKGRKVSGGRPKSRITKICPICEKEFPVLPSYIKHGRGKFCSYKCYHLSLKEKTGEKCPFWKGGISFEPYCHKFNHKFKEKVRDFFGRKCMWCGKEEENNGKRLSVHHVNYDKMTCCNDQKPLFLPLCISCHIKTNHNRDWWENVLTNLCIYVFNGRTW